MKKESSEKPMTVSEQEAWKTVFFIENHLDYLAYPFQVSTPEQVEFMVITEENEMYYPCSDKTYDSIINRKDHGFIQKKYEAVYDHIITLINERIKNKKQREYLIALINIKYLHETRDFLLIPSRLEKRLMKIFLNITQIEDPFLKIKDRFNKNAAETLKASSFQTSYNLIKYKTKEELPKSLSELKEFSENIEFKKLLNLTTESELWESDNREKFNFDYFNTLFAKEITGNGVNRFYRFLGIKHKDTGLSGSQSKKILWLANHAGEIIFDITIIKYLIKLGHKVILSFKKKPLYHSVRYNDAIDNPVLLKELSNATFIDNPALTKNQLADILKTDKNLFIITDGTGENMNLLLTTTTFARIFKEVDCVVSRGRLQKKRFFDSHFKFTQDIYNISRNRNSCVSIRYKAKHEDVIKFSHNDLELKAETIISEMKNAKEQDNSIMFYSGIIGSIPGKIDVAKKIMSVFIEYLQAHLEKTFIINPSNYYEPGMDADDLMYMWEIVQRSGLIDIWRFQTFADIAKSFQLMNEKIPAEWVGKDATFSTGCTKEMKIALDVLKNNREMQIIGPDKEKFIRRKVYGIGKMYDETLERL